MAPGQGRGRFQPEEYIAYFGDSAKASLRAEIFIRRWDGAEGDIVTQFLRARPVPLRRRITRVFKRLVPTALPLCQTVHFLLNSTFFECNQQWGAAPLREAVMQNSFGKQVLGLAGLTAAGLMLFAGLFYMANHFQPGAVNVAQAGERVQNNASVTGGNFYLRTDKTSRFGKTWLTYRGKIDADHFVIDVTIPDLDPQAYYHHKLNITDARKGFVLVGQTYRLLGIQKAGIRLENG